MTFSFFKWTGFWDLTILSESFRTGFSDPPIHLNPFAERIEKPVQKNGPPLRNHGGFKYAPSPLLVCIVLSRDSVSCNRWADSLSNSVLPFTVLLMYSLNINFYMAQEVTDYKVLSYSVTYIFFYCIHCCIVCISKTWNMPGMWVSENRWISLIYIIMIMKQKLTESSSGFDCTSCLMLAPWTIHINKGTR